MKEKVQLEWKMWKWQDWRWTVGSLERGVWRMPTHAGLPGKEGALNANFTELVF